MSNGYFVLGKDDLGIAVLYGSDDYKEACFMLNQLRLKYKGEKLVYLEEGD